MPIPVRARLTCVCGPMFAGKSSLLIARAREAIASGLTVRICKPSRDTRYDPAAICTHDGLKLPCETVGDAASILSAEAAVYVIDEGHFFGPALVAPVLALLARAGTRSVVVAGLERDHRGRAFSPFDELLIEADEVIKLNSRCAVCGAPAIHSQRMVPGSDRIVVGGAEAYQARCRTCFEPGT